MDQLIKDNQIIQNEWTRIEDDAPITEKSMITYKRWQKERENIKLSSNQLAIVLEGDDDARTLDGLFDNFGMIAIDFPKFADGRGYSHARILRDELGYKGELRAIGDILLDQLFFYFRVGFNAFEVNQDKSLEEALERFQDFSHVYQASSDNPNPIYRQN